MLRLATWTMGTRFELVLVGDDPVRLRAAGEEALGELERVGRELSWFARDSRLAHLNRAAAAGPVTVDGETFDLLARCVGLWRATDGAFDPSVAPLMGALGFRESAPGAPADPRVAARAVGLDALVLERAARTVRFARPDLSLDLGGVAKGHGLDLAGAVLTELGVSGALLHGGTSSVLALGPPPGAAGWGVRLGGEADAPVVTLVHGALGVSAPSGRTTAGPDGVLGHVLDPRTGTSAHGVVGAAVCTPRATDADAWSTALVVRGADLVLPTDARAFLRREADGPWVALDGPGRDGGSREPLSRDLPSHSHRSGSATASSSLRAAQAAPLPTTTR